MLEMDDLQLSCRCFYQMLRDPVALAGFGIPLEAGQGNAPVRLYQGPQLRNVRNPRWQDVA